MGCGDDPAVAGFKDPLERSGSSDASAAIMLILIGTAGALILGSQFFRESKSIYAPRRRRPWD